MRKLLSSCCFKILTLVLCVAPGHVASQAESKNFKILIYGATGKVGSQAVKEALNRGHIVTAVSRDPSSSASQSCTEPGGHQFLY